MNKKTIILIIAIAVIGIILIFTIIDLNSADNTANKWEENELAVEKLTDKEAEKQLKQLNDKYEEDYNNCINTVNLNNLDELAIEANLKANLALKLGEDNKEVKRWEELGNLPLNGREECTQQ